eukprot:CAMPEP_0171096742 /NCGR_PEP_ID=MMETSP0766_2-20121228/45799_1 /TAXON_ID=439317 /ORGANISM="Gambierdiscus australes, Strain CAWD 149" /LENGTH=194 /DNA_ID=CAMNT_0011555795 /DNA_START=47 /DNA_END=631 /DNA_ORIENTATION=-
MTQLSRPAAGLVALAIAAWAFALHGCSCGTVSRETNSTATPLNERANESTKVSAKPDCAPIQNGTCQYNSTSAEKSTGWAPGLKCKDSSDFCASYDKCSECTMYAPCCMFVSSAENHTDNETRAVNQTLNKFSEAEVPSLLDGSHSLAGAGLLGGLALLIFISGVLAARRRTSSREIEDEQWTSLTSATEDGDE